MQRALDRMQEPPPLAPTALAGRAQALLEDRFGAPAQPAPAVAFARGCTGLLGSHTHYADGFALLLPLPYGTAVAACHRAGASVSHIAFDGSDRTWTFDAAAPQEGEAGSEGEARSEGETPSWARVVQETVRQARPAAQVNVAVASTVPAACFDAYMAALGMAAARALHALDHGSPPAADAMREAARARLTACTGLPFSIAYLIAADTGASVTEADPDQAAATQALVLVDTVTREHLAVEALPRDGLGWGKIGVGGALPQAPAFHHHCKALADEALAHLRAAGFDALASFRDLEHRDLERAAAAVPERLQRIVRYFVGENRRVQRMVAAARRADGQMFGALLLMSHAALKGSLGASSERLDAAVRAAEAMTIDGMYGACATGRGGCVLAAGQPFVVPAYLDRVTAAFEERFGFTPDARLL